MSLIYQKNAIFSNYKPLDSAVNFHNTTNVSPTARNTNTNFKHSPSNKLYNTIVASQLKTTIQKCISPESKKYDPPKIPTSPKTIPTISFSQSPRYLDDIKMNVYLTYLMKNQILQNQQRHNAQSCISMAAKQSHRKQRKQEVTPPIEKEKILLTDVSTHIQPSRLDHKHLTIISSMESQLFPDFGSMQDVRKKPDFQFATVLRITSEYQHNYNSRYAEKIASLCKSVSDLMKNLTLLNTFLNNKKKLFYVVKKLIYLNAKLKSVLMNDNRDALVEPLTESNLLKNIQHNETLQIKNQSITVSKFDFSIQKDILNLIEQIQDFILQKRVESYELMEQNIKLESKQLLKLESKMLTQSRHKKLLNLETYVPVRQQDFSFKTQSMTQCNPHLLLESIEQRLGFSSKITVTSRTVSKSIEKIVSILDNNQLS